MEKITLLLVEDNNDLRTTMEGYFKRDTDLFETVISFSSIEPMLATELNLKKFILLLDINLPGMNGIEGIFHIKNKWPTCEIIMISVLSDSNSVFKSICAGASGYLDKETPLSKIKEAIVSLQLGGSPITPAIARKIFDYFQPTRQLAESLTQRELEVVQGIVDGLSYKLIADRLILSIDTIRKYIRQIYGKLHINSKGELLNLYHKNNPG